MSYQSTAPNMLAVVEECARRYPREFGDCHYPERGDRAWDFIKLLAATLHEHFDTRWGLNGKRGNVRDWSMDALSYRAPASPAGGVEIYDVVLGAGANNRPAWIDQTMATVREGTIGAWVRPPKLADLLAGQDEISTDPPPPAKPDEPKWPENPSTVPGADVATMLHQIIGRLDAIEGQLRASNAGTGMVASLINDNFDQLFHTALANERRRIFGILDEDGVTHPGVAEEAARLTVERLYERNKESGGALRVKVDTPDLGGIFGRRGLVSEPEEGPQEG